MRNMTRRKVVSPMTVFFIPNFFHPEARELRISKAHRYGTLDRGCMCRVLLKLSHYFLICISIPVLHQHSCSCSVDDGLLRRSPTARQYDFGTFCIHHILSLKLVVTCALFQKAVCSQRVKRSRHPLCAPQHVGHRRHVKAKGVEARQQALGCQSGHLQVCSVAM